MSIINGSLDRRTALLEAGNLRENPFVRTEPPEDVIDRIFVGQPLTPEECREIIQRNLEVARLEPESQPTLRPFEEPVVDEMVKRARGLPRPLNLMADAALEEALRDGMESGTQALSVGPRHLRNALLNEGDMVLHDVGAEARKLLARIFQRRGYVSGAELDGLAPPGRPTEAVRNLEDLSQRDAVLPLDATEGIAFALTPTVDRALASLEAQRERLRALWTEATTSPERAVRGKSLEDFAAAFFGESFKVVQRNARTDTEELDLVLERMPGTDPRFRETYLLVECKNWRQQPVDQKEISTLAGKMDLHHRTQAFLLTSGDFTEPARQQAAHAFSARKLEILLLDGREIEQFLSHLKTVGDFLVDLHRRQTLLRDYPRDR